MNETTLKTSFAAVKRDFDGFQGSMNEWIVFLDHSQRDTKVRMHELERRLRQLESKMQRERFLN